MINTMRKTIILMLSVALLAGCAKQLSLSSQPQLENECVYTPAQTQFTFWSNVAEQMEVRIYDETNEPQVLPLTKGENDFWTATVEVLHCPFLPKRRVVRRIAGYLR